MAVSVVDHVNFGGVMLQNERSGKERRPNMVFEIVASGAVFGGELYNGDGRFSLLSYSKSVEELNLIF